MTTDKFDQNHEAQVRWTAAGQHSQSAQHSLEDAARILQQLGPLADGSEYAARVREARLCIDRALESAEKAAAEYAASDAVWEPIEHCTLGL